MRNRLDTLAIPTLILHRRHTRVVPIQHGVYLVEHILSGRFIELDGADQSPITDGTSTIADLVTRFREPR